MKRSILLCLLLFQASHCLSEPSSSVRWLMSEPASLFDIGMLRLRDANRAIWSPELKKEVSGQGLEIQDQGVGGVVYDWDENKITISASFYGKPSEDVCKETLKKYKNIISGQNLDVSKIDERLWASTKDFVTMIVAGNFDHVNHSSSSGPKDWREKIISIIEIVIGIEERIKPKEGGESKELQILRELAGGKSIFCSSQLFSDIVSYKKYGF